MAIDLKAVREAISTGLPRTARWMIRETPLDFDFSAERFNLRRVDNGDIVGGPVPDEWAGYRLFGMYDYAEGGGASPYIAINENDGSVAALDIERQGKWSTVVLFNSSLDRFIRTFALFDEFLGIAQKPDPHFDLRVQLIDPEVYASSDWRELVDLITCP